MNKRVTSTLLILGTLISLGAFGLNYRSLDVTKISKEFNLKEADVLAVIEAIKDENLDADENL